MLHNITICAAVIVFTALTAGQVQAADKGKGTPNLGVSEQAPGDKSAVPGEPGKSGNAPGDLKPKGMPANTFAPGFKNQNSKRR